MNFVIPANKLTQQEFAALRPGDDILICSEKYGVLAYAQVADVTPWMIQEGMVVVTVGDICLEGKRHPDDLNQTTIERVTPLSVGQRPSIYFSWGVTYPVK